jgi:hypothetical protein
MGRDPNDIVIPMRFLTVLVVFAGATLAVAAPRAGLVGYRGARGLCSEHVAGGGMHVSWTTAGTSDPLAMVVAFYEQATGLKAKPGARGERTIGEGGEDVVSVYPAAKHADFPHCETSPVPDEQTVILISHAVR